MNAMTQAQMLLFPEPEPPAQPDHPSFIRIEIEPRDDDWMGWDTGHREQNPEYKTYRYIRTRDYVERLPPRLQ